MIKFVRYSHANDTTKCCTKLKGRTFLRGTFKNRSILKDGLTKVNDSAKSLWTRKVKQQLQKSVLLCMLTPSGINPPFSDKTKMDSQGTVENESTRLNNSYFFCGILDLIFTFVLCTWKQQFSGFFKRNFLDLFQQQTCFALLKRY